MLANPVFITPGRYIVNTIIVILALVVLFLA